MAERAKAKAKGKKAAAPKGRKRKVLSADPKKHNQADGVPDEVYDRNLKNIERTAKAMEKAKEVYDSARGAHRDAYREAKDDGCDIEAIKLARQLHKQDHGIVITTYSNTGRVLALMESPLAEQLDLFANLQPAREKVDAPTQGLRAGRAAEPRSNNPYPPGSEEYQAWDSQWLVGEREIISRMGSGSPAVN